eukprot:gene11563-biopygen2150
MSRDNIMLQNLRNGTVHRTCLRRMESWDTIKCSEDIMFPPVSQVDDSSRAADQLPLKESKGNAWTRDRSRPSSSGLIPIRRQGRHPCCLRATATAPASGSASLRLPRPRAPANQNKAAGRRPLAPRSLRPLARLAVGHQPAEVGRRHDPLVVGGRPRGDAPPPAGGGADDDDVARLRAALRPHRPRPGDELPVGERDHAEALHRGQPRPDVGVELRRRGDVQDDRLRSPAPAGCRPRAGRRILPSCHRRCLVQEVELVVDVGRVAVQHPRQGEEVRQRAAEAAVDRHREVEEGAVRLHPPAVDEVEHRRGGAVALDEEGGRPLGREGDVPRTLGPTALGHEAGPQGGAALEAHLAEPREPLERRGPARLPPLRRLVEEEAVEPPPEGVAAEVRRPAAEAPLRGGGGGGGGRGGPPPSLQQLVDRGAERRGAEQLRLLHRGVAEREAVAGDAAFQPSPSIVSRVEGDVPTPLGDAAATPTCLV